MAIIAEVIFIYIYINHMQTSYLLRIKWMPRNFLYFHILNRFMQVNEDFFVKVLKRQQKDAFFSLMGGNSSLILNP